MGQTNVTCSQHVPDTYIPQSTAGRRPRGKRAGGAPHERQGKGCPPVDGPPFLPSSHHFTSLLYSPPHSFMHSSTSQRAGARRVPLRLLRFALRQLNSAPPTAHASHQPQGCELNKPRGSDHERGSEERGPDP